MHRAGKPNGPPGVHTAACPRGQQMLQPGPPPALQQASSFPRFVDFVKCFTENQSWANASGAAAKVLPSKNSPTNARRRVFDITSLPKRTVVRPKMLSK